MSRIVSNVLYSWRSRLSKPRLTQHVKVGVGDTANRNVIEWLKNKGGGRLFIFPIHVICLYLFVPQTYVVQICSCGSLIFIVVGLHPKGLCCSCIFVSWCHEQQGDPPPIGGKLSRIAWNIRVLRHVLADANGGLWESDIGCSRRVYVLQIFYLEGVARSISRNNHENHMQ